MEDIFPLKEKHNNLRITEKYEVKFAHTARLQNSAIPALQRMLNEDDKINHK